MGKRGGERAHARRSTVLALALVLTGVCVAAARADGSELTTRVEALLTAGVEPGAAHGTIVALGEPAAQALKRVFQSSTVPRYVRLRALTVLASFESRDSARFFQTLVQRAQEPVVAEMDELHPARSPLVLLRALQGLVASASFLGKARDLNAMSACLGHVDAHVRKATARLLEALEVGPDDRIDQALSARLASEPSSMVRASVQRALTSRSARSQAPR